MGRSEVRTPAFRARGNLRRERLLSAARELLANHDLDTLSLADVAAKARIPKASAYHYHTSIMDLYAEVLAVINQDMYDQLRRPLRSGTFRTWSDVVAILVRRGVRYFDQDPAARQLVLSPKAPPELKRRDRQSDMRLGALFIEHISAYFVLPESPGRSALFFRALEIADLMFSLSVLEHGRITSEMTGEAVRAVTAYLGTQLPSSLPRRRRVATRLGR